MKKKIVLVTLEKTSKERYVHELKDFFSECVNIVGYSLQEGMSKMVVADLVIITSPILTNMVKPYISDDIEIIYLNRTFRKGNINKLYDIPNGTEAMLVNNARESSIDTISLLYEMGIKHITFIPVYPKLKSIPNCEYAVTPGQTFHVPKQAQRVFNIGWRVTDISTLMDIATKLDILDDKLNEKMMSYLNKIIPISHGLHFIFKSTYTIENQLNIILNTIDDGVVITDRRYVIRHYNKSLQKILSINDNKYVGNYIFNSFISDSLKAKFIDTESVDNYPIELNKNRKTLVVTKKPIMVKNSLNGYVFIVKDKTEIEKLEGKLRQRSRHRGHVTKYTINDITGISKPMLTCKEKAMKISKFDKPVLITGESGTGKELFAQSIHSLSSRKNRPFLAINCAALSNELLESELFGYVEGAFTGANKGGKKGMFEAAHTGTLFLDEIGELSISMQVKLLRVLQEKEVMRVGGTRIIPVDIRIIAATNKNLRKLMKKNKFREDLYYRLNVLSLNIPPIRERKQDILCLIKDIIEEIGITDKTIDDEVINVLCNYSWPGNVRELRNCIEYMLYLGEKRITVNDLPDHIKNRDIQSKPQGQKNIFPGLTTEENDIAKNIIYILRYGSAGRRTIVKKLLQRGLNTTEYKVRKIMDYLCNKEYIIYGKGRKGAELTKKGKSLIIK